MHREIVGLNVSCETWLFRIRAIDYFNNIVYRPNENQKGIMKLINHESYYIKWGLLETNYLSSILDIKKIENNKTELKKLEKKDNYVVPNIIHFVYGFKKQNYEKTNRYRWLRFHWK